MWDRYLKRRRGEDLAPGTLELYGLKRRHFLRWAEAKGLHSALSFQEKHYYEYAAGLKERGLHESTIYTHLVALKQVFKWAQWEKLIVDNPVGRPKLRKPVFGRHPWFSSKQVAQIEARRF